MSWIKVAGGLAAAYLSFQVNEWAALILSLVILIAGVNGLLEKKKR